jgi:hypothetical protein
MAVVKPDMETLEIIGYEVGQAFAAFMRGMLSGFSDYSTLAPEESVNDSNPDKEIKTEKTRIEDCKECWCNTCEKLEYCTYIRNGHVADGIQPKPCIGCADYLRFKPTEHPCCKNYIEGPENNG